MNIQIEGQIKRMQGRQTQSDSVGTDRVEQPQQPNQTPQSESPILERSTRPLVDFPRQQSNGVEGGGDQNRERLSEQQVDQPPVKPVMSQNPHKRNNNGYGQTRLQSQPFQPDLPVTQNPPPEQLKGPLRTQPLRRDFQPEIPQLTPQNGHNDRGGQNGQNGQIGQNGRGAMPPSNQQGIQGQQGQVPPNQAGLPKRTIIQSLNTQPLRRDQPGVGGFNSGQNGQNGQARQNINGAMPPPPSPPAQPVVKTVQTQPLRGKSPVEEKPKPPVLQTLKTQPLRREMLDNLQLPKRSTGFQPGVGPAAQAPKPSTPPPPVGNRTQLHIGKAIEDVVNSAVKRGTSGTEQVNRTGQVELPKPKDSQFLEKDNNSKRTLSSKFRSVVGAVSKSNQPISLSISESASNVDAASGIGTNVTDSGLLKKKAGDAGELYSQLLQRCSLKLDRPELRLRFINNMLAGQMDRQKRLQQALKYFQFLENTRLSKIYSRFYSWILEGRFYNAVLEETRSLLLQPEERGRFSNPLDIDIPIAARIFTIMYQTRRALYATGVLMVAIVVFGLYSTASWSAGQINDYFSKKYEKARPLFVAPPQVDSIKDNVDYTKVKEVFKLNSSNGVEERYSNNCRINITRTTRNRPRGYYLIPRGGESNGEVEMHDPIGILYHTTESDIVAFNENNVDSIERSSKGALGWVVNRKSYNYLIDRVGTIYRVVPDEQAANHAGNSIWADDKSTYVGLNDSFIGICFESTIAQGNPEEALTEAQIDAGKVLTAMLRYKYKIPDENCTTHGLVSINPEKMLIAHHYDWVRGFPFSQIGISDKYKVQPAYMSDYGFTYDDQTLKNLGNKLWVGAAIAEAEFKQKAERLGLDVESLRKKQQGRYYDQYNKAAHLRSSGGNGKQSKITVQLPNSR